MVAFILSDPTSWSVSAIYNIQAGAPYSPALPPSLSTITYEQNSASKSMQWEVDLKIEKYFSSDHSIILFFYKLIIYLILKMTDMCMQARVKHCLMLKNN